MNNNMELEDIAQQGFQRRLEITSEEATPELVDKVSKMVDMPISEIICDDNINKKLIIEAEDVESVTAELNKLYENWGDTFIIEKDQ